MLLLILSYRLVISDLTIMQDKRPKVYAVRAVILFLAAIFYFEACTVLTELKNPHSSYSANT